MRGCVSTPHQLEGRVCHGLEGAPPVLTLGIMCVIMVVMRVIMVVMCVIIGVMSVIMVVMRVSMGGLCVN